MSRIPTPFSKPGRFWRGNLHAHSTNSDGLRTPAEVCRFYASAGYDFLALTDHFTADYGWPLTDTRAYRAAGFTTLLGAELHPVNDAMELGNGWHIVAVGLPTDFAPADAAETGPDLAARALASGAWVAAAHPQWFGMTERDLDALGPIHALEIFNASAHDDNDAAESSYLFDLALARGRRLHACATDDSHFVLNTRERLAGWVMVKSALNTPAAILAALKAGDFYASSGPTIFDLTVIEGILRISCSPAERIFVIGGPATYASVGEQGITEATFDLRHWPGPYVRVLVRDLAGRKAWSNPIWLTVGPE